MVSASTQVGRSKMDQYGLSAMVGWNRLKSTDLKESVSNKALLDLTSIQKRFFGKH
jgi:hypothetical protein